MAGRVTPSSLLFYPITFAAGTAVLAAAGWLGGHLLKIIIPNVVPTAHAVATGLMAPASLALYLLASRINRKGGPVNYTLSLIGGYIASIYAARALGFSVTLVGPIAGLSLLSFPFAASAALIAPLALALIAITNVGKTIRDFLLHGE